MTSVVSVPGPKFAFSLCPYMYYIYIYTKYLYMVYSIYIYSNSDINTCIWYMYS